MLVGGAAAIGWVIQALCRGRPFGALIEALLIGILVAQRSLFLHVAAVALALRNGGLEAGRKAVSHIVGRDPARLDRHGVARAAIESLAENFSDGVVAPVFWYLIGGLPGLFAYKMANTLDSMIGHRSERYRAFGWAAARFDDLLNLAAGAAQRIAARRGRAVRRRCAAGREALPRCCATRGSTVRRMPAGRRRRWPARSAWRWPARAIMRTGSSTTPGSAAARRARQPADIGRALRLYYAACLLLSGGLILAWMALHVRLPA